MPSETLGSGEARGTAITPFQRLLLNEFWDHYLAHDEWPKTRVVHSRHEKSKTQPALEQLGGHVVSEMEDHNQGNRYALSATGALLTKNAKEYRRLLLQYLEYLRTL